MVYECLQYFLVIKNKRIHGPKTTKKHLFERASPGVRQPPMFDADLF